MREPDAGKSGVFDEQRIVRIVELMKEHDLLEVDLREGERQIRIQRNSGVSTAVPMSVAAPVPVVAAAAPVVAPAGSAGEAEPYYIFKAPMVGTFYSKPNPNAAAFVKVGDHVEPEATICIIEAMKVFNEIPAEVRGKVVAVLASDGEPVDFGKPLYKIDLKG